MKAGVSSPEGLVLRDIPEPVPKPNDSPPAYSRVPRMRDSSAISMIPAPRCRA